MIGIEDVEGADETSVRGTTAAGWRGNALVRHPPGDPAYEALLQTVRTSETMRALLTREVAAVGLTIADFDVLGTAWDLGETSQRAIADQLLLTRAGVGKVLDRLEQRGLVRRRTPSGDARVRLVTLTKAGDQVLVRARIAQDRVLSQTVGSLPPQEQTALVATMRHIEELAERLLDN